MPVAGAVISAAGSLGGGIMGSNASREAANTQAQAGIYATQQQRAAMQDAIGAQAYATMPGRNVGTLALYQLSSMLGIDPRQAFPGGRPDQGGAGEALAGGGVPMTDPNYGYARNWGERMDQWSAALGVPDNSEGYGELWKPMAAYPGANLGTLWDASKMDLKNMGNWFKQDGGPEVDWAALSPTSAGGGASLIPGLPAPRAPGSEFGFLTRAPTLQDLQFDPSYGFRLNQNLGAIENSAAARGMQLSGSTLKDLSRFSQDYASQEFGNAYGRKRAEDTDLYNRFASLAGIGQTAAAQTGQTAANASMTFGNQAGANALGIGNALAAGQVGAANAMNSGIQGATNSLQTYLTLQQLFNNQNNNGGGNG